ncbi:MAG: methyltransferase [Acidobacteriota bacterium]
MSTPGNDASRVMQALDGFRLSKAVFVAVSLRLFDKLHQQSSSCHELARELGCDPDALERILGTCTAAGLLTLDKARYSNTLAADRFLRTDSPETLTGYVLYSDRILYRLWAHLEDAVRKGGHRWEQEFGRREGIFDHFFATEDEKRLFLAGMTGMGLLSSPAVVAAWDLGRFRHLVDLGGASGHLAIAACRRYAHLRATVFDLPAVTEIALSYIRSAGMDGRIDVVGGDFFVDPLPDADLFSVGRILHDWSEDNVVLLLRRIHSKLPPAGGLLIAERLLNDERDGPLATYLQSLNMLVCTEGKERSPSEYEALLRDVGFQAFEFHRTGQPVDAMLAVK